MSKQDVIDYVMETPHNTNKAVLEGLVDTAIEESQFQADWNQNDPTAKDYIKNRICYEETGEDKTYTLTPNRNNDTWNFTNGDIPLILGQSATVKSFGGSSSTFVGTVTQDSDGKLCIDATSVIPITIYSNTATYNYSWIGNTGIDYVTVTISSIVVHQIDPKFIPIDSTPTKGSTNAASSDALAKLASDINGFFNLLPESVVAVTLDQSKIFTDNQKQIARNNIGAISSSELVQSDWNQNDTSASDYIKNKPTIDTALSSTSENAVQNKVVKTAIDKVQNAVEEYIGSKVSDKELILFSSTENSTKKFKITVNHSGTISAKEVTEGA